ncbi:MAG: hypothetical protein M0Z75_06500 [Nitrospiraceae bacterium]|nr:hypothetical protein [Nitrospiraceae bacterium]
MKRNPASKNSRSGDAEIIIISSISSTATYIFVDKMLQHMEHPLEELVLAIALVAMFVCIVIFFRKKGG